MDWTPIEPKDQDRIWSVALALLGRSQMSLPEALQAACAEFYGAERALRKGVKFYVLEGDEQVLRKVRELEQGTWVYERARTKSPPKED